ncbi:MAG: hypothetical protein ACRC3B_10175, partial [Bacteroidia bacterium]
SFTYILLLLQVPLAAVVWLTLKASGKKDWRKLSWLIKIVMLAGISFLFVYAYKVNQLTQAELTNYVS